MILLNLYWQPTVLRAREDDRQLGVKSDTGHVLGVTFQGLNTCFVLEEIDTHTYTYHAELHDNTCLFICKQLMCVCSQYRTLNTLIRIICTCCLQHCSRSADYDFGKWYLSLQKRITVVALTEDTIIFNTSAALRNCIYGIRAMWGLLCSSGMKYLIWKKACCQEYYHRYTPAPGHKTHAHTAPKLLVCWGIF